ncbi:ras-like protein 1 [Trichomonascus vanleenenianus]|uniref:ras-like protein 1 n=1 Tax=Trichomonascus vanleenenianus TaxID=2268995 RepID=UPI003EC95951
MKMSRRESNPLYKLIVLGDGGVGKTALTIQLCLNHFVETYDPTIEDSYRKNVVIDDQPAILEVLDTAGQEEFTALRDQWIRDGEGFILVYSITSRSSFMRIRNYYSQIQRVKEEEDAYSLVLVGNKCDRSHERQVSTQEGEALARELGNVPFFESSAKLNINTENAFFACARKCRLIRDPIAYQQYLQRQQQQQQQQQQQDQYLQQQPPPPPQQQQLNGYAANNYLNNSASYNYHHAFPDQQLRQQQQQFEQYHTVDDLYQRNPPKQYDQQQQQQSQPPKKKRRSRCILM